MTSTATKANADLAGILARAREVLALDGWSRERLLDLQRSRLRELVAHAVARSPHYREALGADAAGAELHELPTLSKPQLMDEFDRIVTDTRLRLADLRTFIDHAGPGESFAGAFRTFATSGATGFPGLFVYTHAEFAEWTAAGIARLGRVGVTGDTRLVAIGAPGDEHITRQLFAAFQAGRTDVPRLSATTPLAETISALESYQPEAIIVYASVLDVLAQEQLEGRLGIAPRTTISTTEVLTDETVARVREAWGSPPANAYAATEAPGMASDSPDRVGMHVWEESVILEVVDDDNRPVPAGEPGTKVLLTNLVNHAQPLIRYELSDSVVLADGPDRSGRPFTRLARVDGRSDDILTFPGRNGHAVRIHPFNLRAPFASLLDVRRYQIVQRRDGRVCVRVAGADAPELLDHIRDALVDALSEAGAVPPPVEVEPVAAIVPDDGHAAKLRLVISER